MTIQSVNVRFTTSYSGRGTKSFQRDLSTLNGEVSKVAQTASQSFSAFGRFSQAAGTALMVGVGAALAVGIKAAIDFEDAFAGVRKTVDASEGTFEMLAAQIREMATQIPIAATELAAIGALGGQLGIPTHALEDFIDVVARLGVTTNLETDQAATSLARFVNVMGSSDDEFDNIASSIVDLGNNFATTEAEILNFGTRLSGIGAVVGLTEGDVLGLSAAFTSLGEPAERGATAVQRAFQAMFEAVNQGGEDLELFAEVVGITADEFATLFQEDPGQAFLMFSEGLAEIIANGGDVVTVLDELGLGSVRTLSAMLKAATGTEIIAEGLERGNEAFQENIALTEESEKRFGTMASQIKILGNQFTDLRIEIGNKVAPAFKDVLSFAGGFFDVLRENMGVLQGFAIAVGVLAGARGILALTRGFGSLLTLLGEASVKMTAVGVAGLTLQDRLVGIASKVRAFGGVIGAAAIAVGVVGVAMAHNRQLANEYQEAIENLTDAVEAYEEGTGNATEVTNALGEVLTRKTGIFDFTVDLEDNTELLHDLGISVQRFATLALTDVEEFDKRMKTILKGHFGLDDEVIQDLFENGFQMPVVVGGGTGQFAEKRGDLIEFLKLLRETEAATASLRQEEELRRKERELEMIPFTGEVFGEVTVESLFGPGGNDLNAFISGITTSEDEYTEALTDIIDSTKTFSDDFTSEWDETVASFTERMFDWESAWDGYEQVADLSTSKLKTSIDRWVADQERLTNALGFVYANFGTQVGDFFSTLPEDLQRGLAATLAEAGPEKFSTQLGIITDAWGELLGFSLDSALIMAPSGAQKGLEAWSEFFENELNPIISEHAPEGSQAYIDAVIQGFSTFRAQMLEESPELASAFDDLVGAAIAQMDQENELLDIEKMTANMTTAERIQLFVDLGLSWAEAIALGFGTLPEKMGTTIRKGTQRVKDIAGGRNGFDLGSPSKVAIEWGKQVALGFGIGLDRFMPMAMSNFTKIPTIMPTQSSSQPAANGPSITIVNPQHKDDDVLDGVKRAATLVGLTRAAEETPGFN